MRRSGLIYSRDLSPNSAKTVRNSKTSTHTFSSDNSLTAQQPDPNTSNQHKDTVFFTLNPHHNDSSMQYLPTSKYIDVCEAENSFSSQASSSVNESYYGDSLAIYENPITKNNDIVRKLGLMNNMFKELGVLKKEKLEVELLKELELVENELIELEREILRT